MPKFILGENYADIAGSCLDCFFFSLFFWNAFF